MTAHKRVAILGGTFNPIHNGHIALAHAFAELLELDEVLLMVDRVPPHKAAPDLASGADRMAMAELARQTEPLLRPCDLELHRRGKSYTYATLRWLCRRHPDTEYYFLTGADMFLTLHQWRRPQEICRRAVICAAPRDAQSEAMLRAYAPRVEAMGGRSVIASFVPPPISSTQVRARAARGESLAGLVPQAVAEYIHTHGLYQHREP